jgi:DNA-binding transcriptional LysR family regulator
MLNEISIMCFLSVAKHLSFSKAAEEVFVSRQAVSKKILSLEDRLGAKLFDRTTSAIELTVEGKLYLDFFRKLVQDFETLSETIGKTGASMVRLLIGYELGVIIDKRVIEIIGAYKRRREDRDNIKIRRYEARTIESKLLSGQLDIAFTAIPKQSRMYRELPYIVLEQAEYVLVTSKNHPKAGENTLISDFDGAQAVYWNIDNSDDAVCRKNFSATWFDIGATVVPRIQCTSLSSAYAELLLGNAVLLCNAKNEICTFPDIITYPSSKKEIFGCVWSRSAPPEVREFAEAFRGFE